MKLQFKLFNNLKSYTVQCEYVLMSISDVLFVKHYFSYSISINIDMNAHMICILHAIISWFLSNILTV